MAKVYIGGDMLYKGSQLLRKQERDIVKILGHEVYNPADNKDINDKEAQGNALDLPDRIVIQDTQALKDSDIIILDCQRFAEGTLIELGQITGMKDLALQIEEVLINEKLSNLEKFNRIFQICNNIIDKKVYPHCEDIRRHDQPEVGDNRSFYINAYLKGICNWITNGKGLYEWSEIENELK